MINVSDLPQPHRRELIQVMDQHLTFDPSLVHTNLEPAECICAKRIATVVQRPPQMTGDGCITCGGMMVRTGTCTTCTECGATGGCG